MKIKSQVDFIGFDGETCYFNCGDVVLLEDTWGKGPLTASHANPSS